MTGASTSFSTARGMLSVTEVSVPADSGDACRSVDLDVAIPARDAVIAADFLRAAADPLRLRVLSFLGQTPGGEACACDFAALTDVSQPTVSHHLKVLRDAGVLASERRGTWVWYSIVPHRKAAVAALLAACASALAPSA